MKKAAAGALCLFVLLAFTAGVAGCGSSGGTASDSSPAGQSAEETGTINTIRQKADSAASSANLRLIDSAIQQYYAATGDYPTTINQLSQYFTGGLPVDPSGGAYYLVVEGGVPRAAVR